MTQGENELTTGKTFVGPDGGKVVGEEKLMLDGKKYKSEAWGGSPKASTANWNKKDAVLKIDSTITFERDGRKSTIDIDESRSPCEEGKVLFIKQSSSLDWGERTLTIAFTKAAKK